MLAGLIGALLIAPPTSAQEELPRLVVHVSDLNPLEQKSVQITLQIYDPGDELQVDLGSLIEIRNEAGSRTRPAMTLITEGLYTTDFSFFNDGAWTVVALPDIVDRSVLATGDTDEITLDVRSEWSPAVRTIAFLALIAGGAIVAVLAGPWLRRPKDQPKAQPTGHDTWWASP